MRPEEEFKIRQIVHDQVDEWLDQIREGWDRIINDTGANMQTPDKSSDGPDMIKLDQPEQASASMPPIPEEKKPTQIFLTFNQNVCEILSRLQENHEFHFNDEMEMTYHFVRRAERLIGFMGQHSGYYGRGSAIRFSILIRDIQPLSVISCELLKPFREGEIGDHALPWGYENKEKEF